MLTHNRIHVSYSKEIKCVSFCKAPRCPIIELLIRLHTGLFCLQSSVHLIILLKKRASLSQAATKWYKKCAIKQHLQEKKKLGNFHGNLGQLTELQLGHICCSPRDSAFSKNLDNNNLKFSFISFTDQKKCVSMNTVKRFICFCVTVWLLLQSFWHQSHFEEEDKS